jgi:hypothetical protein
MSDTRPRVFGGGFLLAALLMAFAAQSQEAAEGIDDIGPAVDTSADQAIDDIEPYSESDDAVAERDLIEPSVDTSAGVAEGEQTERTEPAAVLAADVTRSQSGNQVMDRMELGRTEITGNQELPKVLYIVPWQKADPGDLMGKPVNTLLDEVLAPVDREEFVRTVDYYGDLYGEEGE